MTKIRKAVIPAAGFGTRMLPITKVVSKEMLPLVDKPILQIVVEELVEAGIEDIIVVTSANKADMVDYFSNTAVDLTEHLRAGGPSKEALLQELESVKNLANFAFIEQRGVYGTGTPVLNAEPYLGNEPFIYTFADDFFIAQKNSYVQMLETYEKYQAPIIGCQRRTRDADYNRYGYVGGEEQDAGEVQIKAIVEHPGKANTPGDLASLGGFIVTPEVLPYLQKVRDQLPAGKELLFNAAFGLMVEDGKQVIAKEIADATYFDTGNKLEYMKTVVAVAARHPEIGAQFKQFLDEFTQREKQS
ncbi:MAG TPA: sugar phosphate nucleotidyltransferase [Candidatus Saccharimonadales bacterium]|jgi:UTP--glucose-1-phosphate uridylyltransferase